MGSTAWVRKYLYFQQTIRHQGTWGKSDTIRSEWIFETVRSKATLNGFVGAGAEYAEMPPGMVPDDDYIDDHMFQSDDSNSMLSVQDDALEGLPAIEEGYETDGATKGSDSEGPQSTVIIRGTFSNGDPQADNQLLGAPPAYNQDPPSLQQQNGISPPTSSSQRRCFASTSCVVRVTLEHAWEGERR